MEEAAPPSDQRAESATARGTILLVDDDAAVLRACKRMLSRIGFDVLCAKRGALGLELFREHGNELAAVMVDLSMPDMDGAEVVRAIRELDGRIPVFVCTGHDAKEASQRLGETPITAIIEKPYSCASLLEHLQAPSNGR